MGETEPISLSKDETTLPGVKKVLLVLSGKGGVGKSTVTTQLARAYQLAGKKVGVLDIDICGPSIPKLLHVEDQEVHQCDAGWVPVFTDVSQNLSVMSIGFLLANSSEAVVWRGPKKNAMIKQFLTDVHWQDRDLLIIDTPPGTSDEHITVMETLKASNVKVDGAVVVTTPQAVALGDVRRELTFCHRTGLKVVGIVENMSGYVCPNCSDCSNIFSKGGGAALAESKNIQFLGAIPIDPKLAQSCEDGDNFLAKFSNSVTAQKVKEIVDAIEHVLDGE
ncbi:cytosolic Fe-S cluster assembly factor NUBP2 homolog [Tigriopus californicus]|uniref:cytosolic Fe-S cluster assembly factor NUBP2 homolog n=1 Tax=Tigriopus californicus TaxID=6832 RepID=UPI0027DA501F|nr:cytosolic Fe-S cluster assembly factor NUBP2 homolog [Tigriopus californicus]